MILLLVLWPIAFNTMSESMRSCEKNVKNGMVGLNATAAVHDLMALPFVLHDLVAPLLCRAFDLAKQYNQHSNDCLYVALAEREGVEFWTGDQRLVNGFQSHYSFVRWIADYKRRRP
jgi:predicted nucleic acid-binding protein